MLSMQIDVVKVNPMTGMFCDSMTGEHQKQGARTYHDSKCLQITVFHSSAGIIIESLWLVMCMCLQRSPAYCAVCPAHLNNCIVDKEVRAGRQRGADDARNLTCVQCRGSVTSCMLRPMPTLETCSCNLVRSRRLPWVWHPKATLHKEAVACIACPQQDCQPTRILQRDAELGEDGAAQHGAQKHAEDRPPVEDAQDALVQLRVGGRAALRLHVGNDTVAPCCTCHAHVDIR